VGHATQRTRDGPPGRSHLSRMKGLSAMTGRDRHHPRTQSLSRVDNGSALTSGVANRVVRGAGEPALQPPSQWEGRAGSVMVANRTRESRPSGMTWGACGHVDNGGTRHPPRLSKERVLVTLCLKSRAPQFYPDSSCYDRTRAES